MSVLKRMDEDILEILYSATHVAVYEFDTSRRSWKRSDIEGTLFLVKRCSAPRFRMIVVNSKRIDNFMEEVDGSLECEVLQTFLLYTRGNNQLYGIWFYDEKNCEEFGNYLKRIVKGMPKASPSGTPTIRDKTPSAVQASLADKRSASDLRNELQSIFNQLNGANGGGGGGGSSSSSLAQINGGGGGGGASSVQKSVAVTSGESDHLMRLFLQAHERSPASAAPLTVATTAAATATVNTAASAALSPQLSPKLPNADVVLSLDMNVLPVATTAMPPMVHPSASIELGGGNVSSPALPTVPLVPLPPDFFKPSGKASASHAIAGEDVLREVAPDPVNLPMPLTDSTLAVTSQTHAREIGLLGTTTTTTTSLEMCPVEGDAVVPSSLARFFAKNEHNGGSHDSIGDGLRDRFRQALVNLLSNDDILDLLIAEFKKVGIPFQSLPSAPPPPSQPRQ